MVATATDLPGFRLGRGSGRAASVPPPPRSGCSRRRAPALAAARVKRPSGRVWASERGVGRLEGWIQEFKAVSIEHVFVSSTGF